MNNRQFIQEFANGTLTRSRYGNLRVHDFNECSFLMTHSSKISYTEKDIILAIKFSDLVLFNNIRQSMDVLSRANINGYPTIDFTNFNGPNDASTSRLIDIDKGVYLLEICGLKYLVFHNGVKKLFTRASRLKVWFDRESEKYSNSCDFNSICRVSFKTSTVKEGLEEIIPHENGILYNQIHWFVPEDNFTPYHPSKEEVEILKNPPNIYQYIDDLLIGKSIEVQESAYFSKEVKLNEPHQSLYFKYKKDKNIYEKTVQKIFGQIEYKIAAEKDLYFNPVVGSYNYRSQDGEQYFDGIWKQRYGKETINFPGWHKLIYNGIIRLNTL